MDDQRTNRTSWGGVMLSGAQLLTALMLAFGVFLVIAALPSDGPKGNLPINIPAFTVGSVVAVIGGTALVFIQMRLRRKN
jgi:hypothetical protein